MGAGRRWLNSRGVWAAILGGWQLNNIVSLRSGTPFTVTASGTLLNSASITQNPADQVKDKVDIPGGIGRGNAWFDPFGFAPVNEVRLGNAGFNSMVGPGRKQWDIGLCRQINLRGQSNIQLPRRSVQRDEYAAFQQSGREPVEPAVEPDGSIRNVNGYTEITSTSGSKSERQLRVGIRLGF